MAPEIPRLLLRTAVKETLAAGVVAGLLTAALFRQRRRAAVVAGFTGVVVMASLLTITAQSFDQSRFQNARRGFCACAAPRPSWLRSTT